jgi:hypothetical protein
MILIKKNFVNLLLFLGLTYHSFTQVQPLTTITAGIAAVASLKIASQEYNKSSQKFELIQNNDIPFMAPNDPDNIKPKFSKVDESTQGIQRAFSIIKEQNSKIWYTVKNNQKFHIWSIAAGISLCALIKELSGSLQFF